jgi:hypothetical protein
VSLQSARAVALSLAIVLVGAIAGCGDDGEATEVTGTTGVEEDVAYALAEVDGWATGEHLDPDAAATPSLPGDPAMDWYSSYVRLVATDDITTSSSVRVSGHALEMTALAEALPGRTFEPASVGSFEARFGEPPAETEPAVILLALDEESALMVLSYELRLDELASWAEQLRVVSDEEWSAVPSRP